MDDRLKADLTGSGQIQFTVPDLLIRPPQLGDYTIDGTIALEDSDARGVQLTRGTMSARLSSSVLTVGEAAAQGPLFEGRGEGRSTSLPRDPRGSRTTSPGPIRRC